MPNETPKETGNIEPTSYLWQKLLVKIKMPKDGIILEVGPGYEPKIGNALALLGFTGTIFLIEPDQKAACHIQKIYQEILPQATVKVVIKPLQKVKVGIDVPGRIDALVASHPFDDMVIASMAGRANFFSQEKEGGADLTPSMEKFYETLQDRDYAHGIRNTVVTWKNFIAKSMPNYFIASQYPSRTLTIKGLIQRQHSGFRVLKELKNYYQDSLVKIARFYSFGYKGDPKWWIIVQKPHRSAEKILKQRPLAAKRLRESIFVPQKARRLHPKEYDIVYVDKKYFGGLGHDTVLKKVRDLAIVLDNKSPSPEDGVTTYADRQKDKTDIGLEGNLGSGRAVYYGGRFNILGVGRTTLCRSTVPNHSTGRLELIGGMRRIIVSKWINRFVKRAPEHPILMALKETSLFKWSQNPVPLCLLVRIDGGSLDRPSHVEQSPQIPVNFQKTLTEYAKLDAEYFAYRILQGTWSTSNYSLDGRVIDLESASFVKYRGPYYTSTSKYPHNRFGYEGLGFLKILRQLADIKNIKEKKLKNKFYRERRRHLGRCLLSLLGVERGRSASFFFSKYQNRVTELSEQFEELAKKVNSLTTNCGLYTSIPDNQSPSLLHVSNLFRNLAKLYKSSQREPLALKYLLRKNALAQIQGKRIVSSNQAEDFLQNQALITRGQKDKFMFETKVFIRNLFRLLDLLDAESCLGKKEHWDYRLRVMNRDLPTMFELNTTLKALAESYRRGKISPQTLGAKIEKLCELPNLSR